MNKYETVFIMNTEVTEQRRKEVVEKIESYISENGEITKVDDMGVRRLAYEVKKQKQGYYYVIEFKTKPENITELERIFRITDEVLKFIVVRQDD